MPKFVNTMDNWSFKYFRDILLFLRTCIFRTITVDDRAEGFYALTENSKDAC